MIFNHNKNVFSDFYGAHAVAAVLWIIAACGVAPSAQAGPGHDHGEEEMPAVATGAALPRFTAISEKYELVGVVNGGDLTLYLDEADSNTPVGEAILTLKVGMEEVEVEQHDLGEFEARLSFIPVAGVTPITVGVSTSQGSEMLSAELDIHEDQADELPKTGPGERNLWFWGALGGIAFAGFGAGVALSRRDRNAPTNKQRDADIGGAA